MSNYFSKRYIPYANRVRLSFYRRESDVIDGYPPVYTVQIDRYSPLFVYFGLESFVSRHYLRGAKPFWCLPLGAYPCTNIRKLHDMDYFDFIC